MKDGAELGPVIENQDWLTAGYIAQRDFIWTRSRQIEISHDKNN